MNTTLHNLRLAQSVHSNVVAASILTYWLHCNPLTANTSNLVLHHAVVCYAVDRVVNHKGGAITVQVSAFGVPVHSRAREWLIQVQTV